MTVLFSSNLDALTLGTYPTGWVSASGAGMQVQSAGATGYPAVSGANGYGRNGAGDAAAFTANGALTNQAVRTACKVPSVATASFKFVGHLLRSNANATTSYRVEVVTDNAALRVQIIRNVTGGTTLATSSYFLAPSSSDIVHLESKITGTLIETWLWIGSTKPSSPTLSYDDSGGSGIASGYPGLVKVNAGWAMADDIVVTDGAGGEDAFYPSGTTISATIGSATASGLSATVTQGGSTTINGTVGSAVASGLTASVATYLVTDPLINNTESLLASQAVVWTWTPSGRIGSMAGLTPQDGTGTTNTEARLVTSVLRAAGRLDVAVRNADATVDDVYYQAYL